MASPCINRSYTEEETEQHVSPEARSLTDQEESDDNVAIAEEQDIVMDIVP